MQRRALERDLLYLTSFHCAGRLSGTDGATRASAYLAEALQSIGLSPAGDSYFQSLEVPAARLTGPPQLMVGGRAYRHRRDFAEVAHLSAGSAIKAPLVVANAEDAFPPEQLEGNVVLIPRRPEGFDLNATATAAAELNVAALLVGWGEPTWFHKTVFGSQKNRIPVLRVRDSVATELAARPGTQVELELPLAVGLLPCRNVIGLLKGTDPTRTVALTAHYDHVGDDPGGERFPGAIDNASGVVTMLSVARTLVERKVTLPFNMLVGFLTGEESGLWGAKYLAAHPPAPLWAVVNLDGMGFEPALRAMRLGYAEPGHWIADLAAAVCQERGIAIRWTTGSDDSAAFQAAGLPALGLGHMSTEPMPAGLHSPDDTDHVLHLPAIEQGVETVIAVLQRLAVSIAERWDPHAQ